MIKDHDKIPAKGKITALLKRYPFSLLCIAVIWYLSFFTPPQTQLDDVPFIDKWVHIAMYGGTCCVIWLEHWRHCRCGIAGKWLALWCGLLPLLMSGSIELLQAYCTQGRRSGDWADFIANALGCLLAAAAGKIVTRHLPTCNKDKGVDDHCNSDGHQ